MAQNVDEWLKGAWQRSMRSQWMFEKDLPYILAKQISNVELYKKTGCNSAVLEIKRRRLRWLGHVLRMLKDSISKVALRWTPPGKRKRGRLKMTWRQTVMAELKEKGLSWGEAQASAGDEEVK